MTLLTNADPALLSDVEPFPPMSDEERNEIRADQARLQREWEIDRGLRLERQSREQIIPEIIPGGIDASLDTQRPARGRAETPTSVVGKMNMPGLNRNVLALDLGTRAGWAIGKRDGSRSCGTENFSPRASWHPGQRFTRFRAWLNTTITTHQITHIVYEKVIQGPHSSGAAGDVYGAFWGMLLVVAESHNIVPDSVHTMTVKKFITGSGRADKGDVISAVRARGYMPDSDNAADAAGILELAIWAEINGADVSPAKATSKGTKAKVKATPKARPAAVPQERLI